MLGRALGFSDPEVIRIIKENFIPVVGDDWYQRRRKDDVGKFFRSVVDQTWKAGKWEPNGGDNRQGIYCFTPSGRMLTEMKNLGSNPQELRRLRRCATLRLCPLPVSVPPQSSFCWRSTAAAAPRRPASPTTEQAAACFVRSTDGSRAARS